MIDDEESWHAGMRESRTVYASEPIEIDWCPVAKIHAFQAFIDLHWSRGHILARDRDLVCWQYRWAQQADHLSILVAQDQGQLVGALGIIQCGFNHRGIRLPAAWLATWAVASPQRNQRLGLRLLQAAFRKGFKVVGCLAFNGEARRIYKSLRFDVRDAMPRWVRPVSLGSFETLLSEKVEFYPTEIRQTWYRAAQRRGIPASSGVRLLEWSEEAASRWDQAWQEQFAPRLLGTWRDANYLRWRYINHPRFQYTVRFAEDRARGGLLGLTVYRTETVRERAERVLRVNEFLWQGAAGPTLARAILEAAQCFDVAFADFYCTSEFFAAPLEKVGFVREDSKSKPLPSLFQPLDFHRDWLNAAFWVNPEIADDSLAFFQEPLLYLTRSDGDQDRPN